MVERQRADDVSVVREDDERRCGRRAAAARTPDRVLRRFEAGLARPPRLDGGSAAAGCGVNGAGSISSCMLDDRSSTMTMSSPRDCTSPSEYGSTGSISAQVSSASGDEQRRERQTPEPRCPVRTRDSSDARPSWTRRTAGARATRSSATDDERRRPPADLGMQEPHRFYRPAASTCSASASAVAARLGGRRCSRRAVTGRLARGQAATRPCRRAGGRRAPPSAGPISGVGERLPRDAAHLAQVLAHERVHSAEDLAASLLGRVVDRPDGIKRLALLRPHLARAIGGTLLCARAPRQRQRRDRPGRSRRGSSPTPIG